MSTLLLHEPPLQVLPSLAVNVGLHEAIVLHRLHEKLSSVHPRDFVHGRSWVVSSYKDWQQEFPFWPVKILKRIFLSLERQNLIVRERLSGKPSVYRMQYSISYDHFPGLKESLDVSYHSLTGRSKR